MIEDGPYGGTGGVAAAHMAAEPQYSLPEPAWGDTLDRFPAPPPSAGERIDSAREHHAAAAADAAAGDENCFGSRANPNTVGLTAKERVLARREMRKREEIAAREGDLMHARQRYFQERVLADNAQRSQYLGSRSEHLLGSYMRG